MYFQLPGTGGALTGTNFNNGFAPLGNTSPINGFMPYLSVPQSNLPQIVPQAVPMLDANNRYVLPSATLRGLDPKSAAVSAKPIAAGNTNAFRVGNTPSGWEGFKQSMGGWGGMAKFGLDAVTGLGELYAGMKALELSRDSFEHNKELSLTNLANQTKTYNTRLSDRANARAHMEGMSEGARDAYIAENRLTRGL